MKAFAVLSGGGSKGAALAGCINAAIGRGIKFEGFGGTSAGSIVALLASIGYQEDELRRVVVDEMPFDALLDDGGEVLREVKAQVDVLLEPRRKWNVVTLLQKRRVLLRLGEHAANLGLYKGDVLEKFLRKKIQDKHAQFRNQNDVTFSELHAAGGKPLKVVTTNLRQRKAAIFGGTTGLDWSVTTAVRASAAYPFVFRPVAFDKAHLVDGALTSNAPVFLFQKEHKMTHYPVFTFNVGVSSKEAGDNYDLNVFSRDLFASTLEASDDILRASLPGIAHIEVPVGDLCDALDFDISREKRELLYLRGLEATERFLDKYEPLKLAKLAGADLKKELQLLYGPVSLFQPIFIAVARECEEFSQARNIRATIMLPTMRENNSRIVVYDHNMDHDHDRDLELNQFAGCSGQALKERALVMVDLDETRRNPEKWDMDAHKMELVPGNRKAMMSVIIPAWYDPADLATDKLQSAHSIGVLSIDTTTPLADTGWNKNSEIAARLANWAKIVGRVLTR